MMIEGLIVRRALAEEVGAGLMIGPKTPSHIAKDSIARSSSCAYLASASGESELMN